MAGSRFIGSLSLALAASAVLLAGCGAGVSGDQGSDPVVTDFPIAYVKRPLPLDNDGEPVQADALDMLSFNAGGDLYVRDRASPSALERNVTLAVTGGDGDVRDVEASYDGTKFLFALRLPEIEGADEEDQPKWNIWEYDIAAGTAQRVIESDITAEAGNDVAPHYLPDGRIVFASDRQRTSRAVLLDEGKPQFAGLTENRNQAALVLHVMNGDGSDIEQISFNASHDLDPTVLADGRVVFSRWDNMGSRSAMHLYSMRPDGTQMSIFYGAHSHDTGTDSATVQFLQPREREDGSLLTVLRPFTGTYGGGDLVVIDTANYIDNVQPTRDNQGILDGPAQVAATANNVHSDGTPSPGGRYVAAYPMWDGSDRMLVSWSPCRLLEGERIVPCTDARLAADQVVEAPPLYGLYIYDRGNDTQLPVVAPEENVIYTDVAAAQDRDLPEILFDQVAGVGLDGDWEEEGVGVLHIRSVYDFDGGFNAVGSADVSSLADLADPARTTAAERAARFIRLVKSVPIPDDDVRDFDNTAYGRSAGQLMREIVGYAPVEPDGSVKIKVPANVPLAVSVLDSNGRRMGARHQNWIQVKPGELLECNGCHDHSTDTAHGRSDGPAPLNTGAATSGLPFTNTAPAWTAEIGETMAETRSRISCQTDCAALQPSVDVLYTDVWTDPSLRAADADVSYRYADLTTAAPTTAACQTQWRSSCRIVINYEGHIHPLWSVNRQILDAMDNLLEDRTCTACHTPTDDMGNARVPAAQLDLTDGASADEPDHFKAYRELLFGDAEQEVADGALQDRLVPVTDANGNQVYETDDEGNLVLDGSGDPIPLFETVPVGAPLSVNGASDSDFFDVFAAGGSHAGYLTDAELRLLSEWADIGAQYYNNPFDAPAQ